MRVLSLHSKSRIDAVLRKSPFLHAYSLGDLDDFFWERTVWYGLEVEGRLEQIVLIYAGPGTPTILALSEDVAGMSTLLEALLPLLPVRLYAHLSPGLSDVLRRAYEVESHGLFHKMGLVDAAALDTVDVSGVERMSRVNQTELEALYRESYPGNWFDARMLDTGCYFGARVDGQLASVAGVHVVSREYRVAALGNITTHPGHRGKGLAAKATAALCRHLRPDVDAIGLNVSSQNQSARGVYERLGFRRIADYEECVLVRASTPDSPGE